MTLTFGSLFAGIGGMDLGLERAGMRCAWQVEINPYAQKVLAKHWPHVPRFDDVRTVGAAELAPVDLIAGGFPCQDISNAGKRAGIDGERSGLWAEFHRLVCELRPRYVLVENVAALLVRGLDRVLGDLAASGYDAEWDCIPAAAVGAPHRCDRLFVVAHAQRHALWEQPEPKSGRGRPPVAGCDGANGDVAHANGSGLEGRGFPGAVAERRGEVANANRKRLEGTEPQEPRLGIGPRVGGTGGEAADPASLGRGEGRAEPERARPAVFGGARSSDLERRWAVEPDVGRVAHGVPARVDRLRGLGNAVVPQVAEFIGRRILEVAHAS